MKLPSVVLLSLIASHALGAEPEPRGLLSPTGTLGPEVYKKRRAQVIEKLGRATTVIFDDMRFEGLREGMDFYWLTGFNEAGAALLLDPAAAPEKREVLLLAARSVEAERWSGERSPLPSLRLEQSTGIKTIKRIEALGGLLLDGCDHSGELAFVGELSPADQPQPKALEWLRKTVDHTVACKLKDQHRLISKLRTVKSPAEIALIRKAIAATDLGHRAAMAVTKAGVKEYVIKDAAEDTMRKAGMRHVAYDSITGSGPNGAVLHYPKDDRVLREGDLVVADIGAEIELYASDVTRTFPVGGKFSADQRAIYDAVLKAQLAGIAKAKPGVSIAEINTVVKDSIAASGYYEAMPHGCCHFVGLEVHDSGDIDAPLPEGAVLTVEPGIYLPERGYGVRIEDCILITKGGNEVLSKALPKSADEIEKLMAK